MAAASERTAGATAEFERLYRANVEAVMAYFARRSRDPQVVADLTADTFVAVITSFGAFDPRKGTARAWMFGIARRVYASYCEAHSLQQHKLQKLAGRRDLEPDQVEELLDRIDAERAGRDLIRELTMLPERDRAVIELVDLAGLRPKEAAAALGLTPGAVRMRLLRTRPPARAGQDHKRQPGVTVMTKFADQLLDDLIREHGPALAHARPPAVLPRHAAAGRKLLVTSAGGVAVAAAATGVLVAGGGTPAYAVTTHPNGMVTLAVTKASGISGANGRLHKLGDRVVIVPVGSGCPSIASLPVPAVQPNGHVSVQGTSTVGGSITVNAKGIPAGDILVVGVETTTTATSRGTMTAGRLTSAPAPSCISLPAPPAPPGGSGKAHGGPVGAGTVNRVSGSGSGPNLSRNG